jgi:hypothetical protein
MLSTNSTINPLPFIQGLFSMSSPSAIAGFIITIVVDTFDTVPRARLWPHVFIESKKRSVPLRTNLNTPTTIVLVSLAFGVIATCTHRLPRFIFTRIGHTMTFITTLFNAVMFLIPPYGVMTSAIPRSNVLIRATLYGTVKEYLGTIPSFHLCYYTTLKGF